MLLKMGALGWVRQCSANNTLSIVQNIELNQLQVTTDMRVMPHVYVTINSLH